MTEMITIERAEYDRLVDARDMLEDLAAFDRAMADYDPDDMMPDDVFSRILEGGQPLAVIREWRGFSQSSLAREAGVNRVQIADIEAARGAGSVQTLKKLAETLRVSIDDLVD